jgi:hypothetical protein
MRDLPTGGDLGGILEFCRRHFPRDVEPAFAFLASRLRGWGFRVLAVELGMGTGEARTLIDRGEAIVKAAVEAGELDRMALRELISLVSPAPPPESG